MENFWIITGIFTGLILGAIAVWIYDSKIKQNLKRLLVNLAMGLYICALFIGATNFFSALGFAFVIGIVGLKWFGRLRANKIPREGDDNE